MSLTVASAEANPSKPQSPRIHLPYLDGLRALAALYVVQEHILFHVLADNPSTPFLRLMAELRYAHYSVVLFIVLSGYCLALPVMRSKGELTGGLWVYIKRRARRLLPPYYAALFVTGLLNILTASLSGDWADVFNPLAWISHLLLIHNLISETAYALNGPMWSVATEWQIYFLFPLFLLPIWRKYGNGISILCSLLLGAGLYVLFPQIVFACSWFVALFAMGMAAADYHFNSARETESARKPYLLWAVLVGSSGLIFSTFFPQFTWKNTTVVPALVIPLDCWMGFCGFLLLLALYQTQKVAGKSLILKFLEWPPMLKIGGFSYSIYLIHMPILYAVNAVAKKLGLEYLAQYLFLIVVGYVVTLAFSYVFYLLFERPFLNTSRRKIAESLAS